MGGLPDELGLDGLGTSNLMIEDGHVSYANK
jgi:hypothetical protein